MNVISALVLLAVSQPLFGTMERFDPTSVASSAEDAGPMLGDLTAESVKIWIRTPAPRTSVIEIRDADGGIIRRGPLRTTVESDHTGTLEVLGLSPGTRFTFSIDGKTDPHMITRLHS